MSQVNVDASNVMILVPAVLRSYRFSYIVTLAGFAVTTLFLTVATGALAQERYRSPEDAVSALVEAVRSDALPKMIQLLGPGSDEILRSGDPVDDAAMRRRFLDAFGAKNHAEKGISGKGAYAIFLLGGDVDATGVDRAHLVAADAAVNNFRVGALRVEAPSIVQAHQPDGERPAFFPDNQHGLVLAVGKMSAIEGKPAMLSRCRDFSV